MNTKRTLHCFDNLKQKQHVCQIYVVPLVRWMYREMKFRRDRKTEELRSIYGSYL